MTKNIVSIGFSSYESKISFQDTKVRMDSVKVGSYLAWENEIVNILECFYDSVKNSSSTYCEPKLHVKLNRNGFVTKISSDKFISNQVLHKHY